MVACVGCGKLHSSARNRSKPSEQEVPSATAASGSGEMDIRIPPTQKLAYKVRWQSGLVTVTDREHIGGTLKGVSGTLYKGGAAAADFSADEGTADKGKGVLTLRGNVKIIARGGNGIVNGSSVTCDRVRYATGDEIIKASGRVTIHNPNYTIGPLAEAWCSNTLSEVASPGEFVPVRHNQPAASQP